MKVKIRISADNKRIIDLIDHITNLLDGNDYDRGAVESARATADNAGLMLGKLIDILATKGVLTKDDLSELDLFGGDVELIENGR